jgi:hypothetical protein
MTRSRIEADREDLLAEAVNLPERIEMKINGIDNPVTIGRNRLGFWSFYFGPEPVYRFDTELRLRRAVRDGKLYRTQGTTLAELTRVRLEEETQLQRRDLTVGELDDLLASIRQEMIGVQDALADSHFTVLREVATSDEFLTQLREFLTRLVSEPIRLAAALPTKRT